jgi:hypothetical protein
MTHLTNAELIDAVEQSLALEGRTHLAACEHCRRQVAELDALLHRVREVEVPDPPSLFWGRLTARIREAVGAEAPPPRLARWFQWPVFVPLGALAMLLLSLISALPQGSSGVSRAQLALTGGALGSVIDDPADGEAPWQLVAALLGDSDLDPADQAGIATPPGSADEVVLQLTSAEQQELVRLLQEELQRSGG